MSLAERYEQYLVPIIMDHWARRIAVCVEPGDRVLDVGCGTGVVSRHAAARAGVSGTVAGLDLSPDMLGVARQACAHAPQRIDWVQADACRMPLKTAQYDVVLSQFSVMFIDDKASALREIRRVLKPRGTLRMSVFVSGPYDQALRRSLGRHIDPDERGFAIWSCGDHRQLHTLVAGAGFEVISLEHASTPSRYASVRQSIELMKDWNAQIAHLADAVCEDIIREIAAELSDCITDDCFACPEPVAVVTARA
jgi:SAM-dependent methyltransferase